MGDSEGFVPREILDQVPWREYVAARYGFRNHWYPALLSSDLAEEQVRPVQLLGERILLKRVRGRVFGIRDQCLHRGVQLSRKIQCFTPDTISCWYHGFTYRFEDGQLCEVLGAPETRAVGRKRIRTYPVEETKGLVFVFVGDARETLPPLSEDVPPGFLDGDLAVRSFRREVDANWRIGAENGFDSTHILIHRESPLIRNADLALPLGLVPKGRGSFRRVEELGGPKGVFDLFDPEHVTPVFTATIGGETVLEADPSGANRLPHRLVGFGQTGKPDPSRYTYSQQDRNAHLAGFLATLGLAPAILVGNSMGGASALGVAMEQPQLVRALVLMGSAGLNAEITESLKPIVYYDFTHAGMQRLVAALTAPGFKADEELIRRRYELSVEPDARRAYQATMQWIHAQGGLFYPEDALRAVTAPTLVVNGKDDRVVPLGNAFRMLELLRNSWGYILPHCGHRAMIEAPEDFTLATRAFLLSKVLA